jgi:hypothetical protein
MSTELDLSHPDLAPAPTTLFASDDPDVIVARATRIADVLAPVISDRHLYAPIRSKKYPTLEAWTLLGGLMPVMVSPHVVRTWQTEDGWGAHAEARTLDGKVVSAADAYCMRDEDDWARKPHHQLASMASTRACSRAMRLPLSFVMSLTGYEVTPAEEMEAAARGETVSGGKGVAPGWRDIGEQTQSHQRMQAYIADHGLDEWVGMFLDSKGYTLPLAKGQMADLRRAMERELSEQSEQSDPGLSAGGVGSMAPGDASVNASHSPGSDPTSRGVPDVAGRASAEGEATPRDHTSPSSASSPAGGGGHQSPPRWPNPGKETHVGGDHKSPPAGSEQEAAPTTAHRSPAEGSNPDGTEPGAATRGGATTAPGGPPPPGRNSGATKRSRPAPTEGTSGPGRATTDEAEQAAFEQSQAERDPREWTR